MYIKDEDEYLYQFYKDFKIKNKAYDVRIMYGKTVLPEYPIEYLIDNKPEIIVDRRLGLVYQDAM